MSVEHRTGTCEICGATVRLRPDSTARAVKCPRCGSPVDIETPEALGDDGVDLSAAVQLEQAARPVRKRKPAPPPEEQAPPKPKAKARRGGFGSSIVTLLASAWSWLGDLTSMLFFDLPILVRIGGPLLGLAVLFFMLQHVANQFDSDPEAALKQAGEFAANARQLRPGMTRDEVEAILGKPHEIAVLWWMNGIGEPVWAINTWQCDNFPQAAPGGGDKNAGSILKGRNRWEISLLGMDVGVNTGEIPAAWTSGARLYAVPSATRSAAAEILHLRPPEGGPGVSHEAWERRTKAYEAALTSGIGDHGLYVYLEYDDQARLKDAQALTFESTMPVQNAGHPSWWHPGFLGANIVQAAGWTKPAAAKD